MTLSESDAKFKYCPLLKTHDDKMKFCMGSMCMFWTWVGPERGDDAEGCCGAAGAAAVLASMAGAGAPAAVKREDD